MEVFKRRPSIKKTCDFCNSSAFGLMRRHYKGKTFCSAFCEASFTNSRMFERPKSAPTPRHLHRFYPPKRHGRRRNDIGGARSS
jgi:hypothetical protein